MNPTTSSAKTTSDRLTTVLSYGALLLLIYLVFRIVEPFLEPLAWSGVLAIIFYPAHLRIMRRQQPNRAALVSTLGVTVLLIVPALVVLVTAVLPGVVGRLAFTVGGIASAIFWGVLIAFFSLVPVVGSALIWVPGAVFLGFSGHWGRALVVVVICGGVASVADNIVRPLLLRNLTQPNEL